MEAAPRLDRRTDDHELGATLGRDAGDLLAEAAGAGADDLPLDRDPVGSRDGGGRLEPRLQAHELPIEVRVDRELTLEDGRRDEHDSGAPLCGETAGEVDGVLRLVLVEERHHDAAVRDRARPARKAPDVGPPHRMSW